MIGRQELESLLFMLLLLSVLGAMASAATSTSRAARRFQAAMVSFAAIAFCTLSLLSRGGH